MEIRLLDLGSPITTHQPSSRFCNNAQHSLNTCQLTNITGADGEAEGFGAYLGEEWCNDRPSHLLLSLQLNLNQNWTATVRKYRYICHSHPFSNFSKQSCRWNILIPLDVVLFCHFIRQLNVGVAVTESSYICHLCIWELQQSSPVLILHFHDVKDALYTLMNTAWLQ